MMLFNILERNYQTDIKNMFILSEDLKAILINFYFIKFMF